MDCLAEMQDQESKDESVDAAATINISGDELPRRVNQSHLTWACLLYAARIDVSLEVHFVR